MKHLKKAAIIAAGAALVTQAAQAGSPAGDLILGFTQVGNSSGNDYTIDLGSAATITSTPGTTDYSSSFSLSTFNSTFSSASSANAGVVGGNNLGGQGSEVWTTQVRTGSNPSSSAGTETHPTKPTTQGGVENAGSLVPAVTIGTPAQADPGGLSWSENISTAPGQNGSAVNSFVKYLGTSTAHVNPMANIGSSLLLVEDLWSETLPASGTANWVYDGFFTLDFTNPSSPLIEFTSPVAVPEPATYGLLAGAGLLALSLRRQLKNA